MVESSGLLNRRSALKRYRGFESPPLRQNFQGLQPAQSKENPLARQADCRPALSLLFISNNAV